MLTKRNLLIAALLFIPLLVYFLYISLNSTHINVIIPKKQHIRHFVYATGSVEPVMSYKVAPNSPGYIKKILVDVNDQVAPDQILVEMDSQVSYKKLEQSKAKLDHATKRFESSKNLKEKGVISDIGYSQVVSEYDQAKAEYELLLSNYSDQSIKSAAECKILNKYKEPGDYVAPGEPILLCGHNAPIRVISHVDEDYVMMLKEGQTVLIMPEANTNNIYEAKITKILPYAEKVSKSYTVYIDLPSNISLPLGLSVRTNILVRENLEALVVPANAVFNSKVQVIEGNALHERRVNIGVKNYEYVEILDGLSEQEKVVVNFENKVSDSSYYKEKLVKF